MEYLGIGVLVLALLIVVLRLSGFKLPRRHNRAGGEHPVEPADAHPPAPAHGAGGGHGGHHGPGPFGKAVVFGLYLVMLLGAGWVGVQIWTAARNAPTDGRLHAGVVRVENPASHPVTVVQLSEAEILTKCMDTVQSAKTYPASPDGTMQVRAHDGMRICYDQRGAKDFDIQCKPLHGDPVPCTPGVRPERYFYRSDVPIGVWFISPYKGV